MFNSIIGNKNITLPHVTNWNTNNNIKKDPPKSIHTKHREKIHDTNKFIRDQELKSDRIDGSIRKYALNVNPMVAVSYSNNDGNSYRLPYQLKVDEFQKYAGNKEKLDTLKEYGSKTRLNWRFKKGDEQQINNKINKLTTDITNLETKLSNFKDENNLRENYVTRKELTGEQSNIIKQGELKKYRQHEIIDQKKILNKILQNNDLRSENTVQLKINKPTELPPRMIKNNINEDHINYSTTVEHKTQNITKLSNQKKYNTENKNYKLIYSNINKKDINNKKTVDLTHLDLSKYISNNINYQVDSNMSNKDYKNNYYKSRDEIKTLENDIIKNNVDTYKSKTIGKDWIHSEKKLDKGLPSYNFEVNKTTNYNKYILHDKDKVLDRKIKIKNIVANVNDNKQDIYKNHKKSIKIRDKISAGGFNPTPNGVKRFEDRNMNHTLKFKRLINKKVL